MRRMVLAMAWLAVTAGMAAAWYEPARGSAERRALMDAIRHHAEAVLGAPVEFVVDTLRVEGDVAFAMLSAQRPGGVPIDIRRTPAWARGEIEPEGGDPLQWQVLYRRSGATWVAVEWGWASTDVWWAYGPICAIWRPVIAEYCNF